MYRRLESPSPRIFIMEYSGKLKLDETRIALEEVKEYVDHQSEEFVVISIISNLSVSSPEVAALIKEGQEYGFGGRLKRVIRVTGLSIAKIQWKRSSREVGYEADDVSTLEEAIELALAALEADE